MDLHRRGLGEILGGFGERKTKIDSMEETIFNKRKAGRNHENTKWGHHGSLSVADAGLGSPVLAPVFSFQWC